MYDATTLRFFGKLWEPLEIANDAVRIVARDPYAEYAQRRVRELVTYTAMDAGLIAHTRLGVQNGYRNTYLRVGTRQASVNRDRTYLVGTLEGEIVSKLSEAADGYFFQTVPVDGVDDVMGDLVIKYPNAGATRESVRFEYGKDTRDNIESYAFTHFLPRNRMTVASSQAAGGRISKVADDAASIAEYGLFEDETTFSDVTDVNLLEQHAKAEIRPSPPFVVTIKPGPESPLLYTDFDVGDFVRLRILHGAIDLFVWVRVLEATLEAFPDGYRRLASVTVEFLVGGKPGERPERLFRRLLDEQRRRLEALERRVEGLNPPAAPPPGGGDPPDPPSDPTPPPPPPPPAPSEPPTVSGFTSVGVNEIDGRRGIQFDMDVSSPGLGGSVRFTAGALNSPDLGFGVGGGHVSYFLSTGTGSFSTSGKATNSAGSATASGSANVPSVPFG